MAPFSRGPRNRSNTGLRGRGGFRGRGGGREQGSAKGVQIPSSRQKSTFLSTRVEEPGGESSDEIENLNIQEKQNSDSDLNDISSEEDAISPGNSIKPYNVLLQSLNTNVLRGQPLRKKRRISRDKGQDVNLAVPEPSDPIGNHGEDLGLVEEVEEAGDHALEEVLGVDSEEESASVPDGFEMHFANPDEETLASKIIHAKEFNWKSDKSVVRSGWKSTSFELPDELSKFRGGIGDCYDISALQLKNKLEGPAKRHLPYFDQITSMLASAIFGYKDVLFAERTPKISQDLQNLTCLHALNHVFKTRDKVIKNNTRVAKENSSEDREYRDQGFTRPKVLILLPTRQSCVRTINTIMSLYDPEQQENKKRFQDSYVQSEDQISEDKPEDFRELFAGNDDDMFRLGIKFTRKTIKYFSQFYNSDIILASPLGLKMAIGVDDAKKQDRDFLSSIEIVIVDQTDTLLMQNWEHVEIVFRNLNLQPKETHGCDFSRVRNWYLDGNAKYLRQTIILSAFNTPEINRIFNRYMHNVAGKVKLNRESFDGAMLDMALRLKQTFSRYDAPKPTEDPNARFDYFSTSIIPSLTKFSETTAQRDQGVLVFIPSYLDFVRIRNYFANSITTQNISFGSISEYTSVRDVARARSHFFSGRHSVLLYTGRAHHFRRYHLRGVKRIIMYALPDNPVFYKEIVGDYLAASVTRGKADPAEVSVRSIFSKLDALKLERIVGTLRVTTMLREKGGDTFDFL